jgi:2',3'-cyclic-nucleotide 2'-phosphodiesterase (5'-nucleotidase family)
MFANGAKYSARNLKMYRNMQRTIKQVLLITGLFFILFSCNPSYQLVSGTYSNHSISSETFKPDSAIISIYWPFKEKMDAEMNDVIGFAQEDLLKGKPESKLTNFLADLLLEESHRLSTHSSLAFSPDLAFLNYGGIRTGIPRGDITVRNIFELMPFENELVFIQLSGENMLLFFNLIASRGGDSLSGVKFKIRDGKATDVFIGQSPLSPDGKYWLAVSDYVADGGDSYAMLQNSSQRIDSGQKIRDVIIQHLKRTHAEGRIVNPETDGRIIGE